MCESSYLPGPGAEDYTQRTQEHTKGIIKKLKLEPRKNDAVEIDKVSLDEQVQAFKGYTIDGVKGGQDRFPRLGKRLAHAQTLAVVKQLPEVGGSNDGQMMVQPPNPRRLIGYLTISGSSNFLPHFPNRDICLNGHPITAQITQNRPTYPQTQVLSRRLTQND